MRQHWWCILSCLPGTLGSPKAIERPVRISSTQLSRFCFFLVSVTPKGNPDNLNVSKEIQNLPGSTPLYPAYILNYSELARVNVFKIIEHMARDICRDIFCLPVTCCPPKWNRWSSAYALRFRKCIERLGDNQPNPLGKVLISQIEYSP